MAGVGKHNIFKVSIGNIHSLLHSSVKPIAIYPIPTSSLEVSEVSN